MSYLAERLNKRRIENFQKLFQYEDGVLLNHKISINCDYYFHNYDFITLKKYIADLETLNNARTIFHNNCRKIVMALLSEYNNSRVDIGRLIEQIIKNEA